MAFQEIINSVTEFYRSFLPEVFHKEISPESFSDCFNCPMVAKSSDEIRSDTGKTFSPVTKCRTFIPGLPNYLAGSVLSDQDPSLDLLHDDQAGDYIIEISNHIEILQKSIPVNFKNPGIVCFVRIEKVSDLKDYVVGKFNPGKNFPESE